MPPIFDFSAAVPWLMSGFLFGLVAYWLFRKLSGADRRAAEEIANLNAQLDAGNEQIGALKKSSDTHASKANYYESEFNSLLSTNKGLNEDLVRLQNVANQGSGQASHLSNDLAATRAELEKLRADSAAKAAIAEKTFLDQISGLKSQLTSAQTAGGDAARLSSELASAKSDIEKLRADAAAAAASTEKAYQEKLSALQSQLTAAGTASNSASSDASRLSGDLAAAKSELEKLRAGSAAAVANAEKTYQDQISGLKSQLTNAQSAGGEASGLKGEVTRLTTELANFKSGAQKDFDALIAENDGYKAEAERLAKALAAAQESHQSLAMEHHTAKNDLSQVRAGLEETSLLVAQRHSEIEQLKAKLANVPDVETYKRFKDALDAANRIAAGLPDKA
jgi:chromosome segregation ATPase